MRISDWSSDVCSSDLEAFIIAVPPPPVAGVGSAGGFKIQLRDLNSAEMDRVLQAAYAIMGQAQQTPGVTGAFTTFSNSSPQFYLEIDSRKTQMLAEQIPNIIETPRSEATTNDNQA